MNFKLIFLSLTIIFNVTGQVQRDNIIENIAKIVASKINNNTEFHKNFKPTTSEWIAGFGLFGGSLLSLYAGLLLLGKIIIVNPSLLLYRIYYLVNSVEPSFRKADQIKMFIKKFLKQTAIEGISAGGLMLIFQVLVRIYFNTHVSYRITGG